MSHQKSKKMLHNEKIECLSIFLSKQLSMKKFSWHAECILNNPNWKKIVVTFLVKSYGSETKKKLNNINFLAKRFFSLKHSSGQLKGSAKNFNQVFPPSFWKNSPNAQAFFTQCPRKFQEKRNFLPKKLFTRKSSGDSDCSFEKCVAKVRPEVQEKSHSKLENNWKFLTFKNRSWLIKTNLCTENRYFPKPRQRISSRQ